MIKVLAVLSLFVTLALSGNPLTGCKAGRAVPNRDLLNSNSNVCGYGKYNSKTGAQTTKVAAVNEAFFAGGARCGECYELVGPKGTTTVTVVDRCPSSSPKCGGDKNHFIISEEAFYEIADNTTDIIQDLGFRQVTCDITGDIGLFIGASASPSYFSVLPYNVRIAISKVEVKGSGMKNYENAPRTAQSGAFAWNKLDNSVTLAFPVSLRITAETGEIVSVTANSQWSSSSYIETEEQFDEVDPATAQCNMAPAPAKIYDAEDSSPIGDGFDTSYGFKLISQETTTSGEIHAVMGSFGAVQFVRIGGFSTDYWTSITIEMRASQDNYNNIRVYLSEDFDHAVAAGPISASTTDYTNVTIPMISFNPAPVASGIVIQNNADLTVEVWIRSVYFTRNEEVPDDNAPIEFPVTTGVVPPAEDSNGDGVRDDSESDNGSGSGSGPDGSFAVPAVSASLSMTVAVAVFSTLLVAFF